MFLDVGCNEKAFRLYSSIRQNYTRLFLINKSRKMLKKSGYQFRCERKRKLEAQDEVVRKTIKIDELFSKKVQSDESKPANVFEGSVNGVDLSEVEPIQASSDPPLIDSTSVELTRLPIDSHTITSVDDVSLQVASFTENSVSSDINDIKEEPRFIEIDDNPTNWKVNDNDFVNKLIRLHKVQDVRHLDFKNSERRFNGVRRVCSHTFFFKQKINGESVQRHWLFYSETLGQIFCIFCKIFSRRRENRFITGFDDWRHIDAISKHECSVDHCESARVYSLRCSHIGNVQSTFNKQIIEETNYWRNILKRILSVVRFLSSRGLPFRGDSQQIGESSNGNFLGLIELISEYDPVIKQHLEQYANRGRGSVSYLSAETVNEFIHVMARKVEVEIINQIHQSKYFATIVDSTPDVSHTDQLTMVIRYVDDKGLANERFIQFFENTGHKGIEMKTVEGFVDECLQFQFFVKDVISHFDSCTDEDACCDDAESDDYETVDIQMEAVRKKKTRKFSKSSKMLQYLKQNNLESTFPNLEVALRILETIPVSNASGERSFNSLKRIKSFSRSCLTQEHLNDMTTLFINKDITKSIDFNDVIEEFAQVKSRKILL
ncbi:uncharacterized protein LOC119077809 [Bradysia coprophila]|uniref:uncharacterized protein LOC119077809 n=1 Tax=Bradysia coprophila TaxID=38358 RepID=UPI00187D9DC2|nr:uncharacterized protein LOC119077809 [Bradysia coprophila]